MFHRFLWNRSSRNPFVDEKEVQDLIAAAGTDGLFRSGFARDTSMHEAQKTRQWKTSSIYWTLWKLRAWIQ
jgi:hypothetical protein